MTNNKDKKVLNVPNLRFPEFTEEWKKVRVSNLLDFYPTNSLSWEQLDYSNGQIKNLHYGLIHKGLPTMVDASSDLLPYIKEEIVPKSYTLFKEGDVSFADASEDTNDVAKAIEILNCNGQQIVSGLHTIHGRDNTDQTVIGYKGYAFASESFHKQIRRIAQGTKVFSVSVRNFDETYIGVPSKDEQAKIAKLLIAIDKRIATQNKIIEDLKKLKSAIRKRIFTSLKNEHTENYEINQLLAYEQPSAYIVANDEYSADTTLTPVLTANKGFVLGYTDEDFGIYQKGECIIFDDFTMDAKYVSFPFKVKSSAIKILTAKLNVNLRFMFEYLSYLGLKSEEHKRHYISEIASLVIELPSKEKQNRIANLMTSLDNKLALEEKVKAKYEDKKQYLLSQMFI
ncbi:restriction endonuclease subunit S [Phocaeicola vulgatus]|uniref:restriction endonuclease subunit S n=1 Tax=Phocaeicola TaxID=909656 RepID=UPI001D0708D6|nr:restriction endonuclease subunit S [Phocaeicola vulgatus]MCB6449839.1 restriction endonuclease subunit S [Phocaeicola vulgatus]MCG4897371.1 restriction endonuclease subunit S [Phocaeicola vulgatus]MCG4913218.1 restriction endonuclease subunit S [Phocaeicola vulgatus]MCQ5328097.1 restriction endonuclease subunit S [Phocaeicola vulgatus]